MAPLIVWGKWAVNWTAHDLSVRLSSPSSLHAPKADGEAWEGPEGMASVLYAVPLPGPPPDLKYSVNGEIWPVPSKRGRSGSEASLHSPRGRKQCRTWYIGSVPLEAHPWPALPCLGSARRNCGVLGTGHAAPHRRPRQQRCLPRRPIRGTRGSKSGFACHGYTLP